MQKKTIQSDMSNHNGASEISSAIAIQIFHLFKEAYD